MLNCHFSFVSFSSDILYIYRMRIFNILITWLFFLYGCTDSIGNKQELSYQKKDTCFYSLIVPSDIDMPKTPPFDTTIVRASNCSVYILHLESWGTQTSYNLNSPKYSRSSHFNIGQRGTMDITDLPADSYSMSLQACGNGGGFILRIK